MYKHIPRLQLQTYNGFIFDLSLRGRITIVGGFSGMGKTLLCKNLKGIKRYVKEVPATSPIEKIVKNTIIIDIDNPEELKNIKNYKNKLIIIDNGDNVLDGNQGLIKHIAVDTKNQYIIMSRGVYDFGVTPNFIAEMGIKGNTVVLNYEYDEEEWY